MFVGVCARCLLGCIFWYGARCRSIQRRPYALVEGRDGEGGGLSGVRDSSKSAFGSVLPSLRSPARLQGLSSLAGRVQEKEQALGMQGPGMEQSEGQQRDVGRVFSSSGGSLVTRAAVRAGWESRAGVEPGLLRASMHERHLRHGRLGLEGLRQALAGPARRYAGDVARLQRFPLQRASADGGGRVRSARDACASALCRAARRLRMARDEWGRGGGGSGGGVGGSEGREGGGGWDGAARGAPSQSLAVRGEDEKVDGALAAGVGCAGMVGELLPPSMPRA